MMVKGRAYCCIYYAVADANHQYADVVMVLSDHFEPQKNLTYEKFRYGQMTQRGCESINDFKVRLRVAAAKCEFETRTDEEILRQLVFGCTSLKLREVILKNEEKDQTKKLKAVLEHARFKDASEIHTKGLETVLKTEPVAAVAVRRDAPATYKKDDTYRKNATFRKGEATNAPHGKASSDT
jgi:hypothetical protein